MAEKFIFNNSFDHLSPSGKSLLQTLTPEDLQDAKKNAFEAGRQAGHKAAMEEIEATANTLLMSLSAQIERLYHKQKKIFETIDTHALKIASEAFEKLLPSFTASDQFQSVFQRLDEALALTTQDKEMILCVSPKLAKKIQKQLKEELSQPEIAQHIQIVQKNSLDDTDFTLSWEGGSLDYLHQRLETALKQLLSAGEIKKETVPDQRHEEGDKESNARSPNLNSEEESSKMVIPHDVEEKVIQQKQDTEETVQLEGGVNNDL